MFQVMNRCSNHTKKVNPLIDLVVNMPLFRKFTGQYCACAIFHPWGKKYRINYKGQIFKRSLAMQCLTKPGSKSFSICPTILSKHHLLWTVLWKYTEEKKKSIYLLKTTNQRRDLEVQRFVSFEYLALKVYIRKKEHRIAFPIPIPFYMLQIKITYFQKFLKISVETLTNISAWKRWFASRYGSFSPVGPVQTKLTFPFS